MSDYELPELPSDEDLGITDEDRELLDDAGGRDGPEMSEEEMRALLGEAPATPPAGEEEAVGGRAARKRARRERKEARKAEKLRQGEAERAERVARAAAAASRGEEPGEGPSPPAGEGRARGARGSRAGDGPRSRWRGAVTLAALLVLSAFASSRTGLPRPIPANAPDTVFSSSRAMSTLIEIARDAHPPGSPEHARVRELLVERLRSLGLEPEIQTTTAARRAGPAATTATVRNIVARVAGTDPTGAVLLTAHYDGRAISPAAADDGVGVVTVVETVRALQAGAPLRNDLIVLLTDGEELGLLGAQAFVDEHPTMADVSIVLSFEMRGSAGPSIMFETNEENGWVVRALAEFDTHPWANSLSTEVYRRMPNDTDFTPFREAGKQGLNFAAVDGAHVYHQAYDTPANVSEATLQHHGIHALAGVRHFGQADLGTVDAPDAVFFSVPGLGLFTYDRGWVVGISGILALLLVLTGLSAWRAGARGSGVGAGAVVSLVAGALAYGGAYALLEWVPGFHPERGSLEGSVYHSEGWYMILLAAVAFTSVTALHAVARRWLTPLELGFGATLLPAVAAIGLGFLAPFGAMNLQWPAIAALLSLTAIALLRDRSDGTVGWLATVFFAAPVLLMLVPLSEAVWLALTFQLGAALTVLMTVTLYLCLPALEALRHPNAWWAPLTGLVVAGSGLGLGILSARPSAERPAPSTLVYAYEHGTGSAVWATDPEADTLDADATAWAAERAGAAFEDERDLSGFAYPSGPAPTAAAPVVSAAPPSVVFTRDTIDGSVRRTTVEVRSEIRAEYLAFFDDETAGTRLLTVNGTPLSDLDDPQWVEHWGEPETAVVLELESPADQPLGLHVVEHLLRPEELLGPEAFTRPPDLAPDVRRMSDRAMLRYSVGTFADPRFGIALPEVPPRGPGPEETPAEPGPGSAAAPDSLPSGTPPPDTLPPDTLQPDTAATVAGPRSVPEER